VYNDSGDKSSILDTVDEIDSDDEDSTGSLESLQKLYTVFLHPNKRKQMQKMMISIKCYAKYLHWLTDNQRPNHRNCHDLKHENVQFIPGTCT
jgi:hypothetical protein